MYVYNYIHIFTFRPIYIYIYIYIYIIFETFQYILDYVATQEPDSRDLAIPDIDLRLGKLKDIAVFNETLLL